MAHSKHISFAEIVQGRDSSVRVTDDGLFDVVDTVMVVTGKNCNHSNETLRNLKPSLFDNEKFVIRSGRRYATARDTIELIMILPGKIAKETRSQFAAIIEKHINIQNDPVTGATTVQLRADPVEDPEVRRKRIKREDLELSRLEQEVQEKRIQNLHSFMGLMSTIRPDWMQTDARFRLQTEDMIKNIITTPGSTGSALALTNSNQEQPKIASLSISQLAKELGCKHLSHADSCSVGKLAAKRFRELHGVDPPKHRQWVDGAERTINSYTEQDRGLLTAVLTDLGFVSGSSASSVASYD